MTNNTPFQTKRQELSIADFKKESSDQYEIMLNVYKTLILVNNIIFADSNKNINDKIFEIELRLMII